VPPCGQPQYLYKAVAHKAWTTKGPLSTLSTVPAATVIADEKKGSVCAVKAYLYGAAPLVDSWRQK